MIPSLTPPIENQQSIPENALTPPTQHSELTPQNSAKRPRLTPLSLLEFLQQTPGASLATLTAHFRCSIDRLNKLMNNPEFLRRHKIQTQLSFLQSRLAANQSLPDALAKTIALMHESDKPEVARRAAAALIQIAGLPIRTAMQPAPAPIPDPPAPPEPSEDDISDDEARASTRHRAFLFELERAGVDMATLESQFRSEIVESLRKFCNDHDIPLTRDR